MRKVLSLGLLLGVLVLFGVAVHRLEARRIPDWRMELDRYIAGRRPPEADVRVRSVAAAREPWNMTPEMGHPVTSGWMWKSVRLPFPPGRVMCVRLERDTTTPVRSVEYELVYVCHHSDALWKQGWVVHEAGDDPLSEAVREKLSALGCDLNLADIRSSHQPGQRHDVAHRAPQNGLVGRRDIGPGGLFVGLRAASVSGHSLGGALGM